MGPEEETAGREIQIDVFSPGMTLDVGWFDPQGLWGDIPVVRTLFGRRQRTRPAPVKTKWTRVPSPAPQNWSR